MTRRLPRTGRWFDRPAWRARYDPPARGLYRWRVAVPVPDWAKPLASGEIGVLSVVRFRKSEPQEDAPGTLTAADVRTGARRRWKREMKRQPVEPEGPRQLIGGTDTEPPLATVEEIYNGRPRQLPQREGSGWWYPGRSGRCRW